MENLSLKCCAMGKGKENGAPHHRRVAFYSKPSNLCVSRPRRMDLSLGVSGIAMDDHYTSRADPTAELRQLKSTLQDLNSHSALEGLQGLASGASTVDHGRSVADHGPSMSRTAPVNVPTANSSKAVLSALRALQDKIKKLEAERSELLELIAGLKSKAKSVSVCSVKSLATGNGTCSRGCRAAHDAAGCGLLRVGGYGL